METTTQPNSTTESGSQHPLVRHLIDALKEIAECEKAPPIDPCGDEEFGLHCGVEDRPCQDRYDGANYGYSRGMERGVEWASNCAKYALETMASLGRDCPRCDNSGAYPVEPDGDAEQCEWCHRTPDSKFNLSNVKDLARKPAPQDSGT